VICSGLSTGEWTEKLHWLARSIGFFLTISQQFSGLNAAMMSSMLNREVTIEVIDSLLGQGLGYDEWEARLKLQGYGDSWNEALKNKIIKREYETFKDEILRLKHESNTAPKGKDVQKTNSSESIMKRLQGQEWAKGRPSEKEERLQSRKLLGKDAK
jgi:hypothetical protein